MERNIIEKYKRITEKIIDCIKNDKDCLELMEKRFAIIKDIASGRYNKHLLKNIYNEDKLYEIDMCLEESIKNKLKELKESINKSAKGRQVLKGYNATKNNQNFYSIKI